MELLYVALSAVVGHPHTFFHHLANDSLPHRRSRLESRALADLLSESDYHKAAEALDVFHCVLPQWRIVLRRKIVFQGLQNFFAGKACLFLVWFFLFGEWKLWIMLLIDFHSCKWTHHIGMEGNCDAAMCAGGGGVNWTSELINSQRTRQWRWSKQRRPCCSTAARRCRSTGCATPRFPLRVIGIDSNFVRLHCE